MTARVCSPGQNARHENPADKASPINPRPPPPPPPPPPSGIHAACCRLLLLEHHLQPSQARRAKTVRAVRSFSLVRCQLVPHSCRKSRAKVASSAWSQSSCFNADVPSALTHTKESWRCAWAVCHTREEALTHRISGCRHGKEESSRVARRAKVPDWPQDLQQLAHITRRSDLSRWI
jgi:hypothetical protein